MRTFVLALAMFMAAGSLGAGCGEPAPPPALATATAALNQPGHTGGAVNAIEDWRFLRSGRLIDDSELYWYLDRRDAALWANDPDCPGNDCGDARAGEIPSGELTLSGVTSGGVLRAMCWASRNPDHFTSNPVADGGFGPLAGRAPSWFDLQVSSFRHDVMQRWLPRSAQQAIDALLAASKDAASRISGKSTSQTVARNALRAALNACHYAMDQTACGHLTGNRWCDPNAAAPSRECEQFVAANAGLASSSLVAILTSEWFLGECTSNGLVYPAPFTQSTQYAAAERYIRHHTPLPVAEGGFDGEGTWGYLGWTTTNQCAAACTEGECVRGVGSEAAGSEPEVIGSCANLLVDVRDALDSNPSFFMSKRYRVDPARGCRQVSNVETCQFAGGRCEGFGAAARCMKKVTREDGVADRVQLGSCAAGDRFGGSLPPSCVNEPSNTPVSPACVGRCRAVGGFVDGDGRCLTTTASPLAASTQDSTVVVCGELTEREHNVPCQPYAPAELCNAVGGLCAHDAWNSCVRAWDYAPQPGGGVQLVSDPGDWVGWCGGSTFNAELGPSCTTPDESVWSTIQYPTCKATYEECQSGGECCSGTCRNATTRGPFVPSVDNAHGECGSLNYGPETGWIGFADRGPGSGRVQLSTGKDCTGGCYAPVPLGAWVTLSASPNPGSRLARWDGCDGVNGAQCTVLARNIKTVTATFDAAPQATGRAPIGYLDLVGMSPISYVDGVVEGWTLDQDSPAASIAVQLYVDGQFVMSTLANLPRPDVNQVVGVSGNHGYSMTIPSYLRDLQRHHLEVYAIDDGTGGRAGNPALPVSGGSVSKDFTMGMCVIRAPVSVCPAYPTIAFPFLDPWGGGAYGVAQCAARGAEFARVCGMSWGTGTLQATP